MDQSEPEQPPLVNPSVYGRQGSGFRPNVRDLAFPAPYSTLGPPLALITQVDTQLALIQAKEAIPARISVMKGNAR